MAALIFNPRMSMLLQQQQQQLSQQDFRGRVWSVLSKRSITSSIFQKKTLALEKSCESLKLRRFFSSFSVEQVT